MPHPHHDTLAAELAEAVADGGPKLRKTLADMHDRILGNVRRGDRAYPSMRRHFAKNMDEETAKALTLVGWALQGRSDGVKIRL